MNCKELNELRQIVENLGRITSGSPAGVLADISVWLYNEAPRMPSLIDDIHNHIEGLEGEQFVADRDQGTLERGNA
ncbi:hypothetical protein [Paenibacillus oleatilyticus]|uniref:hypothetical protein n=1 Tax=Paenibacillus oleatilyticus TaxID=2594886 RepID=UPI001C1FF74C|nr:hypothetical protein [Paenibacillus oleatilyticus]MBU7320307.1 hypothetical protein [Paenibacillus oleatilyticus]